jgi:hypothetical protein
MLAIAADPKHLGARIGFTSVLHTWGSAMTHLNLPRVPSSEAFGRRPRCQAVSPTWSRHPKPFTKADLGRLQLPEVF